VQVATSKNVKKKKDQDENITKLWSKPFLSAEALWRGQRLTIVRMELKYEKDIFDKSISSLW
jgi:hypothetical protein